jgi:hypothetical protein
MKDYTIIDQKIAFLSVATSGDFFFHKNSSFSKKN